MFGNRFFKAGAEESQKEASRAWDSAFGSFGTEPPKKFPKLPLIMVGARNVVKDIPFDYSAVSASKPNATQQQLKDAALRQATANLLQRTRSDSSLREPSTAIKHIVADMSHQSDMNTALGRGVESDSLRSAQGIYADMAEPDRKRLAEGLKNAHFGERLSSAVERQVDHIELSSRDDRPAPLSFMSFKSPDAENETKAATLFEGTEPPNSALEKAIRLVGEEHRANRSDDDTRDAKKMVSARLLMRADELSGMSEHRIALAILSGSKLQLESGTKNPEFSTEGEQKLIVEKMFDRSSVSGVQKMEIASRSEGLRLEDHMNDRKRKSELKTSIGSKSFQMDQRSTEPLSI